MCVFFNIDGYVKIMCNGCVYTRQIIILVCIYMYIQFLNQVVYIYTSIIYIQFC